MRLSLLHNPTAGDEQPPATRMASRAPASAPPNWCTRTVGPRVALGPSRRRPGDGPELRLVLVDETVRTALARQLADPAAAGTSLA